MIDTQSASDPAIPTEEPRFEFGILGPLEVRLGGTPVPLAGGRQRTLLAILLLHANRLVAADRLIELLWAGEAPVSAPNGLQVHISQLRRALEPHRRRRGPATLLISRPAGYLLNIDPVQLDLLRFEQLVGEARQSQTAGKLDTASQTLHAALDLWRGTALADLPNEPFVFGERARLEELRLAALAECIEADLALGRHAALIGELQQVVAQYPMSERFCGQLMLALYRAGRQADASTVYHQLRNALDEDRAMEPSVSIQKLFQQILDQDAVLDLSRRMRMHVPGDTDIVSKSPIAVPNNLPIQLTSFIGREREVATLRERLLVNRLVTLVGAGGAGKTRLALQVVGEIANAFADGAFLADLAPVADPTLLPQAIATTLALREEPGRSVTEALHRYLKDRHLVLVLDNCEHLIAACAEITNAVLMSCPRVHVLATSREPLHVGGELAWRVPSLTVPEPNETSTPANVIAHEGPRLFVDRTRSVVPQFVLTDVHAVTIAEICRRLDGMPLALELAAARARTLSLQQIAARLDERFRLLTSGPQSAPARHQTLRAAVEWSYDMLSDDERVTLAALSVFAGGTNLDAAVAVCGRDEFEMIDLLTSLIDKSLVQTDENLDGKRYRLLETVRQFAAQTRDTSALNARHLDHYVAYVTSHGEDLHGAEQGTWLARFELELDNCRAALRWSLAGNNPEGGLRLAVGLGWFWQVRGYLNEGRQWLERALCTTADEASELRADAVMRVGQLAREQGDLAAADAALERSLALSRLLGDTRRIALALNSLGIAALRQTHYGRAQTLLEESRDLAKQLGEERLLAAILMNLGNAANDQGNAARGTELQRQALTVYRRLGHTKGIASTLCNLGLAAIAAGDHAEAQVLLEESLDLFESSADRVTGITPLLVLGRLANARGSAAEAHAYYARALSQARSVGAHLPGAFALEGLARAQALSGDSERAVRLFAAADALRASINTPLPLADAQAHQMELQELRATIGDAEFAVQWSVGRGLELDVAGAEAQPLLNHS